MPGGRASRFLLLLRAGEAVRGGRGAEDAHGGDHEEDAQEGVVEVGALAVEDGAEKGRASDRPHLAHGAGQAVERRAHLLRVGDRRHDVRGDVHHPERAVQQAVQGDRDAERRRRAREALVRRRVLLFVQVEGALEARRVEAAQVSWLERRRVEELAVASSARRRLAAVLRHDEPVPEHGQQGRDDGRDEEADPLQRHQVDALDGRHGEEGGEDADGGDGHVCERLLLHVESGEDDRQDARLEDREAVVRDVKQEPAAGGADQRPPRAEREDAREDGRLLRPKHGGGEAPVHRDLARHGVAAMSGDGGRRRNARGLGGGVGHQEGADRAEGEHHAPRDRPPRVVAVVRVGRVEGCAGAGAEGEEEADDVDKDDAGVLPEEGPPRLGRLGGDVRVVVARLGRLCGGEGVDAAAPHPNQEAAGDEQVPRLHVFLLLLEGQLHRYVHRAALGGAVRAGHVARDDGRLEGRRGQDAGEERPGPHHEKREHHGRVATDDVAEAAEDEHSDEGADEGGRVRHLVGGRVVAVHGVHPEVAPADDSEVVRNEEARDEGHVRPEHRLGGHWVGLLGDAVGSTREESAAAQLLKVVLFVVRQRHAEAFESRRDGSELRLDRCELRLGLVKLGLDLGRRPL
mmetsp:Transcript_29882/g.95403  ORF Transcript_29882/g.95403 Transcript_29882/m.95403 type:complete len:630 (-) Transcript_29882:201-2090(-)